MENTTNVDSLLMSFTGMSPYKPALQEFVDLFYYCISASNHIGFCPQTCHLWKPQLMLSVGPLRTLKTHGIKKKKLKKAENNWEGRGSRRQSKKSEERKINLRKRKQENEEG